jgi:hypothetical protein
MNSVSGSYSYTLYQPSPATNLSSIELVAFVVAGMMWIGANKPIELSPPVDYLAQINERNTFPASPATRVEEAKTATRTVQELASLEDDWDGCGAVAISDQARANAERFASIIGDAPFNLPTPEVTPNPAGTISFEWDSPHGEAYFEIGDTDYSAFIKSKVQPTIYRQGRVDEIDQRTFASIHSALAPSVPQSVSLTEIAYTERMHDSVAN